MEGAQLARKYPQQYRVLQQLWMDLVRVKGWQHAEAREHVALGLCYLHGYVGTGKSDAPPGAQGEIGVRSGDGQGRLGGLLSST